MAASQPWSVPQSIMLLSTQASRYAHQLLAARADSQFMQPLSADGPMRLEDGYEIAHCILQNRVAQGELPVGRRIAFSNSKLWPGNAIADEAKNQETENLIWAHLFDTTVRHTESNRGLQSLQGAVSPKIEPNIVFKLSHAPSPEAGVEEMAECIEWIAHGLEIVDCVFPEWKFTAADAVAAFGLHAVLIVGEAKVLSSATRANLTSVLANTSLSLSYNEGESFTLSGAGMGSDITESPIHALLHLHQLLKTQPQFAPLAAGEIIATGSWTKSYSIKSGQTWTTAFSGIGLPGLTLSFI